MNKENTIFLIFVFTSMVQSVQASSLQEQTIISGHVLQAADQKPVEGAAIELFLHHQFSESLPARYDFEEPYKKAETDSSGSFRFELNLQELRPSLGPVLLIARKKGLATGLEFVSGTIFLNPQNEPIVISLHPPVSLEGKVTDTEGNPVPLAQVRVFGCDTGVRQFNLARLNAISTHTDSAGLFKLEDIPTCHSIRIAVSKPGMGRTYQWMPGLHIDKERSPMEFRLLPAANLKGILIEKSTGKPIAFTELTLRASHAGNDYYSCQTDMKGTFFFEDIEPDKYTLQCRGSSTGHSESSKEITLETGKTTEITYEISAGGSVSFLVADSAREKPLRGVEILFSSRAQQKNMLCSTDETGRGVWKNLEPGEYLVKDVYKQGYRTDSCKIDKPFLIESGKTTSLEFSLSPSPRFRGTVFDIEQKPVPGAEVLLFSRKSFRSFGKHVTEAIVTDSEGRFDIAWDAVDKTPVPDYVFARCAKQNLAVLQPVVRPLDELCRIQMQKGIIVAGQVENAKGQPLADAKVAVSLVPIDEQNIPPLTGYQELSDSNGMFEVPAIPQNCSIRGLVHHDSSKIAAPFRKDAPLREGRIALGSFVLGNK